jgi:hypothetical protein
MIGQGSFEISTTKNLLLKRDEIDKLDVWLKISLEALYLCVWGGGGSLGN